MSSCHCRNRIEELSLESNEVAAEIFDIKSRIASLQAQILRTISLRIMLNPTEIVQSMRIDAEIADLRAQIASYEAQIAVKAVQLEEISMKIEEVSSGIEGCVEHRLTNKLNSMFGFGADSDGVVTILIAGVDDLTGSSTN